MSSIVNNTKEDIIYFKDEVLKDVKKFEVRVNQKVDYQETTTKKKLDYTFHDSKNRNHDYNNKIRKKSPLNGLYEALMND